MIVLEQLLCDGKSGWLKKGIPFKEFLGLAGLSQCQGAYSSGYRFATEKLCVDLDSRDRLVTISFVDFSEKNITPQMSVNFGAFSHGMALLSPVYRGDTFGNESCSIVSLSLDFPSGFLLFVKALEGCYKLESIHVNLKCN
jgi:hypothetical protein